MLDLANNTDHMKIKTKCLKNTSAGKTRKVRVTMTWLMSAEAPEDSKRAQEVIRINSNFHHARYNVVCLRKKKTPYLLWQNDTLVTSICCFRVDRSIRPENENAE
jgi:hypothetical protein